MGVPTTDWVNWCRLCARDDVVFKVRKRDEDLVRIIRKCFDVEMTLEEPVLGSMLCEECYSVIGQLLTFAESVSKIQGIFEILRSSEPQDRQDVDALRREYGLQPTCKLEMEFLDIDDQEDKFSLADEVLFSDHSTTPLPEVPKKLGRPPKNSTRSKSELEEEQPISLPADASRGRKPINRAAQKLLLDDDSQEFFLIDEDTMSPEPAKRKRGRPKAPGKPENLNHSPKQSPMKTKSITKAKAKEKLAECSVSPKDRSPSPPVDEFTCQICKESFLSFMALRSHKHDVHGGPKRFVCDICGKGLKTFTSLVEHKLVHTDEKPCVCPVCNAAFKNKARLRVHSQTHGAPRFKCDVCGKMLQTRANLNKHKYVHTEERRFRCEICGTGSKNSTALKIHLLSHTGLRPYVCKYCGKAFASNTNCRSHKWKKHPELAEKEDESESTRVAVPTLEELRVITREMAKTSKEA
ncbi:zinc finger protein weckle [Drosophila biarmipes]|uniref:zinc finger protein weckle n=1 Tax=Drosophila biarmipes TaxID=125945 RepID=UPI0007E78FFC|nr:zinc finger protein weckle [Drosophila biarmipes]